MTKKQRGGKHSSAVLVDPLPTEYIGGRRRRKKHKTYKRYKGEGGGWLSDSARSYWDYFKSKYSKYYPSPSLAASSTDSFSPSPDSVEEAAREEGNSVGERESVEEAAREEGNSVETAREEGNSVEAAREEGERESVEGDSLDAYYTPLVGESSRESVEEAAREGVEASSSLTNDYPDDSLDDSLDTNPAGGRRRKKGGNVVPFDSKWSNMELVVGGSRKKRHSKRSKSRRTKRSRKTRRSRKR